MPRVEEPVLMEEVTLIFRNFAGVEGPFNSDGDRNFGVLLDHETAEKMQADGWNIKVLKPREEDEGSEDEMPQPWLPVFVSYKVRPPKITLVTSGGRTLLGESQVEILDGVDILNTDLIVRPYNWEVAGKTGIKAMVKSMYVTIEEDPLDKKYADMDQTPPQA